MSVGRKGVGVGVAVVVALVVAALSRVPTRYAGPDDAMLRLSWRLLGTRIEECRERTEEELSRLAPHMRTPQVCEGRNADYVLSLDVDGRAVARDTVRPSGARRDRPVYVLREVPLEPGAYRVAVAFTPLVPAGYDSAAVPLRWEGEVRLRPEEIGLLTLDSASTGLVLRGPP